MVCVSAFSEECVEPRSDCHASELERLSVGMSVEFKLIQKRGQLFVADVQPAATELTADWKVGRFDMHLDVQRSRSFRTLHWG
jgi:hypothetical protein